MIKVLIREEKDKIVSIVLTGHAESADEGKDLVCAGVSTCFLGALKAISDQSQFEMSYSKGKGEITVKGHPSSHDQIVLQVLKEQLTFVAEQKPQFVRIDYSK